MGKRILIVDDNNEERAKLKLALSKNFAVVEAATSEEAVQALTDYADGIAAIVLDFDKSGKASFTALKKLRETAFPIPIIVSSAICDAKTQIKAMSYGANCFIPKPINDQLFLLTLENAITLREKAALYNAHKKDVLTGLYNRESFFELARAMIDRHEAGYYILAGVDIDNFKVINDQHGTEKGDEVLRHVADALNSCITTLNGICCHLTADKFATLYPAQYKNTAILQQSYLKATSPHCIGRKIRIRIGRYLIDDLSVPVNAMYDRATLAENSIKNRYDTFIAEYSVTMRTSMLREQQIVTAMDHALKSGEFEAWLQPQYNHATGALIGAEVLTRWRRNGTYISPAEFVPIFERNGFIYEMDQYIWEQACKLLRKWLDEGKNPLPVSINISRRDLFHQHFIAVLSDLVKKYDIPYDLLRLEITESAFAESSGQIILKVNKLIAMGFTVEIDDFGSGYSSLNTLKDVPASILKLDMKFFENTENSERSGNIVESVVRMAKWLGMAVIAEGVEDKAQADYLKSIGCYYIQGFYYAKPMPISEYAALVEKSEKELKLTRLTTLDTLNNNEFWNPKSMETLIFNSYVGGACIFEYYQGVTELLRVNEQYSRELGNLVAGKDTITEEDTINFMDEANKKIMFANIKNAIDTLKESSCELVLTNGEHIEYIRSTVRLIAATGERYLLYCVIVNMTDQRVAEQKQRMAEEKQTESAQQLQIIMENINGGVSAIIINDDATSKFVFNNEKYYELYGYSRELAIAENLDVMSLILPEDLPTVMEQVKTLKRTGNPTMIDYRCIKRNGELAYLRANASLMSVDVFGNDVIASVVTDITEQCELSEQLKAIVNNINGGVTATLLRSDSPEFIIVNDKYFDILGLTKKEYYSVCKDRYQLVHPEDRQRVKEAFDSSSEVGKEFTLEYRIIRLNGELRYLQSNVRIIRIFGINVPVLLSVTNDVTDLRMAERQTLETKDRLSAVMDNAGNGITATVVHDENAMFLFANKMYYELHDIDAEANLSTFADAAKCIHPDDYDRIISLVKNANSVGDTATAKYRVIRKNGAIAWIQVIITTVKLIGIDEPVQIAVYSDVTADKESGDQLKFLNDSAHDILAQTDSEKAINQTLEKLLKYFSGDRAYIIEPDFKHLVTNNTYEICAEGVTSEMERLQKLPLSVTTQWINRLKHDKEQAETDPLTGLLNRKTFADRMNRALEAKDKTKLCALMLMDIDSFKHINDKFGHNTGDQVLIDIGNTLRSVITESDLVCRLGGDEFLVFLSDKPYLQEISDVANSICKQVNALSTGSLRLSVSIGISVSSTDSESFASLYNKADKALYYVKERGKDNFVFFDDCSPQ